MLSFSIFLKALSDPEMKIQQKDIANESKYGANYVNMWIRGNRKPKQSAAEIYEWVDRCRERYAKEESSQFIQHILHNIDVDDEEKNCLKVRYTNYQKRYSANEEECNREYMISLIQSALDSEEIKDTFDENIYRLNQQAIGIGMGHMIAARGDGRVYATGADDYQQCNTRAWRNIVSVSAGWKSSLGLKADGTCIAVGHDTVGNGELFGWTNIKAVCCGTYHFLGLRSDGTVTAYGIGGDGQCEVSDWRNIVSLAAGTRHSVGLLENGTVVACGNNSEGQCEVSSWKNVIQIAAAGDHTVALTAEGKILLAGDKYIYNFDQWTDVQSIATGFYHIVGLKKDGTILHTGHDAGGLDGVYQWWDIKAVYAGYYTTAGVKSNGDVLVTNDPHSRTYLNTAHWNLFGGQKKQNREESPFERYRKEVIAALEEIRALGFQLSPALRNEFLDHDASELLETIRNRSVNTWEMRNWIIQIKPLADMILQYNALFVEFYALFSFEEERRVYRVSGNAYDACIEYLTGIKMVLSALKAL